MMSEWTRRGFLKAAVASGAAVLSETTLGALAAYGTQESTLSVGLLVQEAGPLAGGAEAAALGADLGANEAGRLAEMLGQRFELIAARVGGPQDALRRARRLVEESRVFGIAGALDLESSLALSEAAEEQGFIFLNISSSNDALRNERCSRNTFHVGASTAMHTDACAEWLVEDAGLRGWHFVISASETGRAAHRRAKRALLERGGTELGHTVVHSDSEIGRPMLSGLRNDPPDVVFLCLDETGRSAFLELYNQVRPSFEVAGPFSSPLRQWIASPETRAGIWPTIWHHRLFKYGAEQLSQRFDTRFQRPMDGPGWAGWIGVKILAEAALRARTTEAAELVRFLESDAAAFDGHKGAPLSFRSWNHQLRQPVYLVRLLAEPSEGADVFDPVSELPQGDPAPAETPADLLDRLGDTREEARCAWADS